MTKQKGNLGPQDMRIIRQWQQQRQWQHQMDELDAVFARDRIQKLPPIPEGQGAPDDPGDPRWDTRVMRRIPIPTWDTALRVYRN
jgi:hypothetical protein